MKKLLFGAIVSTFLLTGCSNVTNSKELKMGEVFNSGKEHISYVIDTSNNVEKDSYVDYVIVSKKGETKLYDMEESKLTLGDFTKMDDNEIKEKALKVDKKSFNASKKSQLESIEDRIDSYNDLEEASKKGLGSKESGERKKLEKEYNQLKNTKYKEPEFKKVKLEVFTDGSGNETEYERFTFKRGNGDDFFLSAALSVYPFDIYDKRYAGVKSNRFDFHIITEVGDKVETPMLDSKDDKYVDEVD